MEKRLTGTPLSVGLNDIGDAHAASGLLSVALSVISGKCQLVKSVDMFGTHQSIVVDSLSTQAPSPLEIKRPLVMKRDFFLPPTLGAHMPSAPSLSDVTAPIPKSNWVTSDTTLQGVEGTERAVDVWQEHSVMNESVTAPGQDAEESQSTSV